MAPATPRTPVSAVRVELYAPAASFRDPMFPGVSRCLPVPPPSTVRGMLAAATGREAEPVAIGMCAHADGTGTDAETFHPVAADGSNPAVAGRVRAGKGGTTLRDRPFLAGVHLSLWVVDPDAERLAAALRRPVWPLRLGRSQDLVHIRSFTATTLLPADHAVIGHALAPAGGHEAPQAKALRLAETVSPDRSDTRYGDFLWCPDPAGRAPVAGAYRDEADDQAVWLHHPHPEGRGEPAALTGVWAKSAAYSAHGRPETLTEHSRAVHEAADAVAERIAAPGVLADRSDFWPAVRTAALLHDAGKVAEGFQRQLRGTARWGERHEVLSLAYLDLLTGHLPPSARRLAAAAVAFHHRPLDGPSGLRELHSPAADWNAKFGTDPAALPGQPRGQIPRRRHEALLGWYADRLGTRPHPMGGRRMWEIARDAFTRLDTDWSGPLAPDDGLVAVLAQGALTLADHCGSAGVALQTHMPLPGDYLATLADPYTHQKAAAGTSGHLVLRSPTGSGKTEAALAWASRQVEEMPGRPRLVWVLPYRASIDAARRRLADGLVAAPGHRRPDIAVLHATAAQTLLTDMTGDDGPTRPDAAAASAAKARAQAGVMTSLFAQRVRVSTPHQLLRAAIAGPRYSSVLLEQANAVIILDELHAYDPATFGRICAAMRLWERLGSRVAVLSATLAPPMLALINGTPDHAPSLTRTAAVHTAPPGTAPDRHRLALDERPITDAASLQRVTGWLEQGHSVLIVANTVATAQHLYQRLAPDARRSRPGDPDAAVLLHSRFRARDRADIERRILHRHPERRPGDTGRRGGLVVATQALEVSLCLDFDRGVSELAPVEALAQRAGRVNRRGRHPDGPVEFRVHEPGTGPDNRPLHRPYDLGAIEAARHALHQAPGPEVSEDTIETWLRLAYATDWGRQWAEDARRARDDFERDFLTFTEPFEDRTEYAARLDEAFDTVEILHTDDQDAYRAAPDPLLAAELLIPIRHAQFARLRAAGRLHPVPGTRGRLWATDLPYDTETGLDLTAATGGAPPASGGTIL